MINWWKIASIILLLYVLIAGFLVPLKPGIADLSPRKVFDQTDFTLDINGYNTNYTQDQNTLEAWLKIDSVQGLKASQIQVIDDNHLKATFTAPSIGDRSYAEASLFVKNEIDRTSIYPSAIRIVPDTMGLSNSIPGFQNMSKESFDTKSGFLFPYRNILNETVRNTFFHITMWFAMFILLIAGLYYAIKVLRFGQIEDDIYSSSITTMALVYGIFGLITGSVWAKYTWGTYWTADVKLNMTAIAMLIYFAYWILRSSIHDVDQKARLSAIYNIFAFVALIPLIFVIPRMTSSLHPGNGGNPALGGEDLDSTLRMVFYPAIIGFTLLGFWIASLRIRLEKIKLKLYQ